MKFPVFVLTKNDLLHIIYWWEFNNMGTIFVPSRTLCLSLEVGIFGLRTEANWSQKSCHGNSTKGVICFFFVMDIYGSKFQEHCFNISRDIVYSGFSLFSCSHWSNLHIIKTSISLFQKKRHSSVFWKAFQISEKKLCHIHFKSVAEMELEFVNSSSKFIYDISNRSGTTLHCSRNFMLPW